VLARRIDEFLTSRGYRPAPPASPAPPPTGDRVPQSDPNPLRHAAFAEATAPKGFGGQEGGRDKNEDRVDGAQKPAEFVCEDDVRQALKQNRKIVIGERSIVTPAARDLGEEHRLFVQASWPR